MVATVAKWGDSLAVRVPQHLAKELHLAEGVNIDLVTGLNQGTAYRRYKHSEDIPSGEVLKTICETYRIQPNEILRWIPSGDQSTAGVPQ